VDIKGILSAGFSNSEISMRKKMDRQVQTLFYPKRPTLWKIFKTWLVVGIQSFGGGSATFLLIQRACMAEGWLEENEFTRNWALAQISPGINLIKLTILIGYKLRGGSGVFAAMAGLLLPSALITVLMTAGFDLIHNQPVIKAIMRGVLPATIGLSLAMSYNMAQPLLTKARNEGFYRLSIHILLLVTAGWLLAGADFSPVVVLLLAGTAAMLALAFVPVKTTFPEGEL
jgi:chromate transporter